jgi:hypothetical protein
MNKEYDIIDANDYTDLIQGFVSELLKKKENESIDPNIILDKILSREYKVKKKSGMNIRAYFLTVIKSDIVGERLRIWKERNE